MDNHNLAVLIDADNVGNPDLIPGLLSEVAKYGTASARRAYGDWTRANLAHWKDVLVQHSIQPVQQFAYTTGKNATDMAMVIDAMDLLYSGNFSGFCIVSSDSDFTRLAARLREAGRKVYGFGEKKTPVALVAACDKFVYTELLKPELAEAPAKAGKAAKELKQDTRLVTLLRNAVQASSDESGWAHLGPVGNNIAKQAPEFDARNYGYAKLGELVKATELFDIEERQAPNSNSRHMYVRDKRKK